MAHWARPKTKAAKAFYATIVIATLSGLGVTLSSLDPIKALFWSAVINGVVSAPVMAMMMLISANKKIMGKFIVRGRAEHTGLDRHYRDGAGMLCWKVAITEILSAPSPPTAMNVCSLNGRSLL